MFCTTTCKENPSHFLMLQLWKTCLGLVLKVMHSIGTTQIEYVQSLSFLGENCLGQFSIAKLENNM
jgi:hypothetical protein